MVILVIDDQSVDRRKGERNHHSSIFNRLIAQVSHLYFIGNHITGNDYGAGRNNGFRVKCDGRVKPFDLRPISIHRHGNTEDDIGILVCPVSESGAGLVVGDHFIVVVWYGIHHQIHPGIVENGGVPGISPGVNRAVEEVVGRVVGMTQGHPGIITVVTDTEIIDGGSIQVTVSLTGDQSIFHGDKSFPGGIES